MLAPTAIVRGRTPRTCAGAELDVAEVAGRERHDAAATAARLDGEAVEGVCSACRQRRAADAPRVRDHVRGLRRQRREARRRVAVVEARGQMKASAIRRRSPGSGSARRSAGSSRRRPRCRGCCRTRRPQYPAHWVPWSPPSPATVCAAIALEVEGRRRASPLPSVRLAVRSGWSGATPSRVEDGDADAGGPPRSRRSIVAERLPGVVAVDQRQVRRRLPQSGSFGVNWSSSSVLQELRLGRRRPRSSSLEPPWRRRAARRRRAGTAEQERVARVQQRTLDTQAVLLGDVRRLVLGDAALDAHGDLACQAEHRALATAHRERRLDGEPGPLQSRQQLAIRPSAWSSAIAPAEAASRYAASARCSGSPPSGPAATGALASRRRRRTSDASRPPRPRRAGEQEASSSRSKNSSRRRSRGTARLARAPPWRCCGRRKGAAAAARAAGPDRSR